MKNKKTKKIKPIHIVLPAIGGAAVVGAVVAGAVLASTNKGHGNPVVPEETVVDVNPEHKVGTLSFTINDEVKDNQVFAYIDNVSNFNSLRASNEAGVVFSDSMSTNTTLQVAKNKVKANLKISNAPTVKGSYTYNFKVTLVYNKPSGQEVRKVVEDLKMNYEVADDFAEIDDSFVKKSFKEIWLDDNSKAQIELNGFQYTGDLTEKSLVVDVSKLVSEDESKQPTIMSTLTFNEEEKTFNLSLSFSDACQVDLRGDIEFYWNNELIHSTHISKIELLEEDKIFPSEQTSIVTKLNAADLTSNPVISIVIPKFRYTGTEPDYTGSAESKKYEITSNFANNLERLVPEFYQRFLRSSERIEIYGVENTEASTPKNRYIDVHIDMNLIGREAPWAAQFDLNSIPAQFTFFRGGKAVAITQEYDLYINADDTVYCDQKSQNIIVTPTGTEGQYQGTAKFTYNYTGINGITDPRMVRITCQGDFDSGFVKKATVDELNTKTHTFTITMELMGEIPINTTITGNFDILIALPSSEITPYNYNTNGLNLRAVLGDSISAPKEVPAGTFDKDGVYETTIGGFTYTGFDDSIVKESLTATVTESSGKYIVSAEKPTFVSSSGETIQILTKVVGDLNITARIALTYHFSWVDLDGQPRQQDVEIPTLVINTFDSIALQGDTVFHFAHKINPAHDAQHKYFYEAKLGFKYTGLNDYIVNGREVELENFSYDDIYNEKGVIEEVDSKTRTFVVHITSETDEASFSGYHNSLRVIFKHNDYLIYTAYCTANYNEDDGMQILAGSSTVKAPEIKTNSDGTASLVYSGFDVRGFTKTSDRLSLSATFTTASTTNDILFGNPVISNWIDHKVPGELETRIRSTFDVTIPVSGIDVVAGTTISNYNMTFNYNIDGSSPVVINTVSELGATFLPAIELTQPDTNLSGLIDAAGSVSTVTDNYVISGITLAADDPVALEPVGTPTIEGADVVKASDFATSGKFTIAVSKASAVADTTYTGTYNVLYKNVKIGTTSISLTALKVENKITQVTTSASTSINEDGTATFTYTFGYSGFISQEDRANLQVLPVLENASEVRLVIDQTKTVKQFTNGVLIVSLTTTNTAAAGDYTGTISFDGTVSYMTLDGYSLKLDPYTPEVSIVTPVDTDYCAYQQGGPQGTTFKAKADGFTFSGSKEKANSIQVSLAEAVEGISVESAIAWESAGAYQDKYFYANVTWTASTPAVLGTKKNITLVFKLDGVELARVSASLTAMVPNEVFPDIEAGDVYTIYYGSDGKATLHLEWGFAGFDDMEARRTFQLDVPEGVHDYEDYSVGYGFDTDQNILDITITLRNLTPEYSGHEFTGHIDYWWWEGFTAVTKKATPGFVIKVQPKEEEQFISEIAGVTVKSVVGGDFSCSVAGGNEYTLNLTNFVCSGITQADLTSLKATMVYDDETLTADQSTSADFTLHEATSGGMSSLDVKIHLHGWIKNYANVKGTLTFTLNGSAIGQIADCGITALTSPYTLTLPNPVAASASITSGGTAIIQAACDNLMFTPTDGSYWGLWSAKFEFDNGFPEHISASSMGATINANGGYILMYFEWDGQALPATQTEPITITISSTDGHVLYVIHTNMTITYTE